MSDITVTVDGHPYTLGRLDARVVEEFCRWAVGQLPDPVEVLFAVAEKLPESYREKYLDSRIDAAVERKGMRGALNDPDFVAFKATIPAIKRLYWMLLKKNHPTLTEDQAFDVVLRAQEEHGEVVFAPVFEAMQPPVEEKAVEAAYFPGAGAGPVSADGVK